MEYKWNSTYSANTNEFVFTPSPTWEKEGAEAREYTDHYFAAKMINNILGGGWVTERTEGQYNRSDFYSTNTEKPNTIIFGEIKGRDKYYSYVLNDVENGGGLVIDYDKVQHIKDLVSEARNRGIKAYGVIIALFHNQQKGLIFNVDKSDSWFYDPHFKSFKNQKKLEQKERRVYRIPVSEKNIYDFPDLSDYAFLITNKYKSLIAD